MKGTFSAIRTVLSMMMMLKLFMIIQNEQEGECHCCCLRFLLSRHNTSLETTTTVKITMNQIIFLYSNIFTTSLHNFVGLVTLLKYLPFPIIPNWYAQIYSMIFCVKRNRSVPNTCGRCTFRIKCL